MSDEITESQERIDGLVDKYSPTAGDIDVALQNMGLEIDRLKAALEKIHYGVCEPTIAAVVAKALASCKGEEEGDS